MKISTLLAASILATVVVASPLVSNAQNPGAQVTHFRTIYDTASGTIYIDNGSTSFYAYAYDDANGVPQGYIEVSQIVYNRPFDTYSFLNCSGTAYANGVSVTQGNGNSSINATLDPASSDCYSFNVSSPLTVSLSGKNNNNESSHTSGYGTSTYLRASSKYQFQSDFFVGTFTGTNGFATGTFDGYVYTEHRTQLDKQ